MSSVGRLSQRWYAVLAKAEEFPVGSLLRPNPDIRVSPRVKRRSVDAVWVDLPFPQPIDASVVRRNPVRVLEAAARREARERWRQKGPHANASAILEDGLRAARELRRLPRDSVEVPMGLRYIEALLQQLALAPAISNDPRLRTVLKD